MLLSRQAGVNPIQTATEQIRQFVKFRISFQIENALSALSHVSLFVNTIGCNISTIS